MSGANNLVDGPDIGIRWRVEWKLMITGSDNATRFQKLIEDHKGIVYKVSHLYCLNRDDREDLAQEIIVQLWCSFSSFDERHRFLTWMYRIALNVAISHIRGETVRANYVISVESQVLETVEASANASEEVIALYQLIAGLDPLHKALILLYLDGYSYGEIAGVLGLSETNVATKISRMKKMMKQGLVDAEAV